MTYSVFRKNSKGVLEYVCTSRALGDGQFEMNRIQEAHSLLQGDVVYINRCWRTLENGVWGFISELDTPDLVYSDGIWSQQMAARLSREASENRASFEAYGNGA